MSKKERFDLISLNFKNSQLTLHDNLYNMDVNYTIYEVINLLNSIAQQEYDIKQLHDQLQKHFENMSKDVSDVFVEIIVDNQEKKK